MRLRQGPAWPLRLLALAALLAQRECQTFLHITYPLKIAANSSEDCMGSAVDESVQAYTLTINHKRYTVYLKQQSFLPNDFMIYTYNPGGFVQPTLPEIQNECFYEGYIQGFPNSVAILSTCSGLRGVLQFENVSYGIEHLESSTTFEHLIYELSSKNGNGPIWTENVTHVYNPTKTKHASYKLLLDTMPLSDTTKSHRYIEVYAVVDNVLFNYLGGNSEYVTANVVQIIGFVNSMFADLNVTVVLSSLEFWTDNNKISIEGEADDILRRFLQWKNSYLVLRPHDLAFLFVYREKPNYVGAAFTGKLCIRNFDAAVALYEKAITLETFSVILAQLLGFSLGMEYEDGKECKCPGLVCIMHTSAINSNGIKKFSSCSIVDFQNFLKFKSAPCLSNRPNLKLYSPEKLPKVKATCGNGILEPGEKCDCGSIERCKRSKCCTTSCTFQRGAVCSNEVCCENCKFKPRNTICRQPLDKHCDFSEYCNGSSAICPANVYVQNGVNCASNTGFCYGGSCQSPDLHCQEFFGSRSRNAPEICYEVNSQADRFGHCGIDYKKKFKTCSLRDLKCGKLICTYPYATPYTKINVPVLYMPVKNVVCVSLDLKHPEGLSDPMMVKEGTKCGQGKICLRQKCQSYEHLHFDCDAAKKCSGHGVCNNKRNCHCDPGWVPPDCRTKGSPMGGSIDSGLRYLDLDIEKKAREDTIRTWVLLSIFLFLPLIVGSTLLAVKWKRIKKSCFEEDDLDDDSDTYSRSEESNTSEKTS
ncbi:disintegrin and metalloproteinase domain-containing protein 32-like [Erythrolamprus reginae]|uniref:disintegrin and metalloproteinase domain-containing protein 32-like n=1 Tax=Erythrolamprus reginae TaxID=121349 RepID=UPI00396C6165